jgi:dCTP diphosphatase
MSQPISLHSLTSQVKKFVDDREWAQFHNPKDLAISLSLEASEVLEIMQWKDGSELQSALDEGKAELSGELADVLYWVLLLAHSQNIDLASAFETKMNENEKKYPISLSKGNSKKYTEL